MDQKTIEIIGAIAGVSAVFLALIGIIITYLLGDDQDRDRVNQFIRACFVALLVVVVVGGIGYGVYYGINHIQFGTAHAASTTYSVEAPGPGCAPGTGVWNYETPADLKLTCRSTGVFVQYTDTDKTIGSLFFSGPTQNYHFPSHYRVTVTVSSVAGDPNSRFGIAVHGVFNHGNAQVLFITTSGYWELDRYATSGAYDKTLASGTATPASRYTLTVEVRGALIGVSINKVAVASVSDPTYTHTDDVSLAIDSDTTVSALFSSFVYVPLA